MPWRQKRQLDVLDKKLERSPYISGEEYTIADMAIFPWYGGLVLGELYGAAEFLDVDTYTHLKKWAKKLSERPAVKRGVRVNKTWGEESARFLSGTRWMTLNPSLTQTCFKFSAFSCLAFVLVAFTFVIANW